MLSSEKRPQQTLTQVPVAELGAWGFITGAEGAEMRTNDSSHEHRFCVKE